MIRISDPTSLRILVRRHGRKAHQITFLVALASTSTTPLTGQTSMKEAQALTTFTAVCMANANHPNLVQATLPAMGGAEAKETTIERSLAPLTGRTFRALLQPLTGKTYNLKTDTADFQISVTDTGACSLYSGDADGETVERLLEGNVATLLLARYESKSDAHSTYAVTLKADPAVVHALVFVDHPNKGSAGGVRLSVLAEQFLNARRQKSPRWPELPAPAPD